MQISVDAATSQQTTKYMGDIVPSPLVPGMARPFLRLGNWLNRPLVRSGFHPYRGSTFLLQVLGKTSGRLYDIPLWFISRGDTLYGFSRRSGSWWKNLTRSTPVRLWVRGREQSGIAQAMVDDPGVMVPILADYFDQLQWRTLPTFFGVGLDSALKPVEGELERASREEVAMIRVDRRYRGDHTPTPPISPDLAP